MTQIVRPLTLVCLLSSVALAQVPPEAAPEAPPPPPEAPPLPVPAHVEEIRVLPDPPKEQPKNAGFDRGFFVRSDDEKYLLRISGRFQPFFDLTRVDATGDYKGQFEMRRMRVVFEGNLHTKSLLYKLQTDFGKGVPSVKDAHFDVKLAKDTWLRFGQWKRPFSRQLITSSGRLEMTERSITDKAFGAGRDVGIALRNDYEKSPEFEWTIGVFNGTGEAPVLSGAVTVDPATGMGTIGATTLTNVPAEFKPALVARAGYNHGPLKGYSEADLEGGPLRFGVAASVWLEGDMDDNGASNQKAELDYIVKANGFSTTGGLYAMTDEDTTADANVFDASTSLVGFHVQAGYTFKKHWAAVGRYAYTNDPRQKAKTAKDQQEIAATVDHYAFGHDAKVQAGVRLIKSGDAHFKDSVVFELGANVGW